MQRRETLSDRLLGYTSSSLFDAANRIIATINPLGFRTSYVLDPASRQVAMQDALGHLVSNVFDAGGRQVAQVDALGLTSSFQYDPLGRTLVVQDARGSRVSMNYDAVGRLIAQVNPLGLVSTNAYDPVGHAFRLTNARGNVETLTFDAVGNNLGRQYADGTFVTLQYDGRGSRTQMQDTSGLSTYAYSARNELVGQTQAGGYGLAMNYDSVGNRTLLIDPDSGRFTYAFDLLNRLVSVQSPEGSLTTQQYDAAGRRSLLLDASGASRQYQYDAVGQLLSQVERNAMGAPIISMADTYDPVGNRTARNKDGVVTSWTYDTGYRLIGQQKPGQTATFAYDGAGNTLLKWQQGSSPLSFSYDSANRLLSMQQGTNLTTYTSDATGNLTLENFNNSLTSYLYDTENRLTNLCFPDGTRSTYAYNGDNLRSSALEAGGVLTTFLWDGDDYLMEKSSLGTVRYTVVEGEVIAEKRNGVRRLYVPDPLGSTIALLDNTQTPTDTFDYWPYGEDAGRTGTTPTPFRYVGTWGYYWDSASRSYVRARVLDKQTGRWLTEDPIDYGSGDWNLYRYATDSPVQHTDPSGEDCGWSRPPVPVTPGHHRRRRHSPPHHVRPLAPKCDKGTACWVTCYHGAQSNKHGGTKGCPADAERGICSSYCEEYGKPPSFPIGQPIYGHPPAGGHPLPFPSPCRICDCGSYTKPPMDKKQWGTRPKCWIDIWVGNTGDCEPGWYCITNTP